VTLCYKCSKPLTGERKVTSCARKDCWLDFTPMIRMYEVVAVPSPDYKRAAK